MTTTKTSAPSVEDIAGHLKPIDAKVLRVLVQHMAPGQATVRLLNDQLAKAVSRTPRTVQSSINRLSKAGLIARECKASKGKSHPIATEVAWPFTYAAASRCTPLEAVSMLAAAVSAPTRKQPQVRHSRSFDSSKPTARFPFRWLRQAHRLNHLPGALASAQQECELYVNFLKRGFGEHSDSIKISFFGMRRKVTTGQRGAPAPNLTMSLIGTWESSRRWSEHLSRCMAKGHNIAEATFRIEADHHPLLLVDDVSAKALDQAPAGSAIVETSPGCYQISVFAPRGLSMQERLFVQRALIERLGGDLGANSSYQLRRFPGSVNNKPAIHVAFTSRLVRVDSAPHFDVKTLNALLHEGFMLSMGGTATKTQTSAVPPLPVTPTRVAGLRDITPSGHEFREVIRKMINGTPESVFRSELEQSAVSRGKAPANSTRLRDYCDRTVRKAKNYLAAGNAKWRRGGQLAHDKCASASLMSDIGCSRSLVPLV